MIFVGIQQIKLETERKINCTNNDTLLSLVNFDFPKTFCDSFLVLNNRK